MENKNKEKELRNVVYQIRVLEERLSVLNNQIEMLNEAIKEANKTIETIDGIKNVIEKNSNSEILLPIGKNILVSVSLKSKNVLIGITDDVFIEKTPEEAKSEEEEKIKKISGVIENLKKQRDEISNKISALTAYAESLEQE